MGLGEKTDEKLLIIANGWEVDEEIFCKDDRFGNF